MSSKENVDEKELSRDVPDSSKDSSSTEANEIKSTTSPSVKSPTKQYAVHYNMEKHGLAIIFNHETFCFGDLERRTGTDRDSTNIKRTLQSLGFEVQEYKDFTYNKIEETIQEVAKQDHTDHSCLIVCILSYGDLGILYAHDKKYKANSIWLHFISDKNVEEKALTLTGKPKLFFIQACQERKVSKSTTQHLRRRQIFTVPDSTSESSKEVFRLPNHADFLIAYSTISGHYSWSRSESGSWFIEALCEILNQFGTQYDLLTLLTSVCRCVQQKYEINTNDNIKSIQKKEVPYITSMLTRLVKFKAVNSNVEN
ncbi:PREDICTED: caspase-1-like isoform X1 [Polistes canadensis]|uniref:caspase-1-like isoform X1 n=2 Tax=Polistes canadensis TaxID=91411 RepID=UPI000718E65F|nr:PREDICTED: caspase-1-like isoform X1 [Polistes canadensis]